MGHKWEAVDKCVSDVWVCMNCGRKIIFDSYPANDYKIWDMDGSGGFRIMNCEEAVVYKVLSE